MACARKSGVSGVIGVHQEKLWKVLPVKLELKALKCAGESLQYCFFFLSCILKWFLPLLSALSILNLTITRDHWHLCIRNKAKNFWSVMLLNFFGFGDGVESRKTWNKGLTSDKRWHCQMWSSTKPMKTVILHLCDSEGSFVKIFTQVMCDLILALTLQMLNRVCVTNWVSGIWK